ncbi:MAG: glycoside hydrolase family 105 protein [Treponema sp.]
MNTSTKLVLQAIKKFPPQMSWHYAQAFLMLAIYESAKRENDEEIISWVKNKFDALILDNGDILGYNPEDFNLDAINPGKLAFRFYSLTGDEKYKNVILKLYNQLQNQPRNRSQGFWHKKIYPWQMWLNGFYMYAPFYARYGVEFGTKHDLHDLLVQIALVESHFKDSKTGLLYQAWDESHKQLWVDTQNGCSPIIFARAVGWYALALVDILDFIPNDKEHHQLRNLVLKSANSLVEPVISCQDKSNGLWYQVMDRPNHKGNYHETSASAMFVNFLYKMQRKHYLFENSAAVVDAAQAGYKGLCSKLIISENGEIHITGICDKAGLGGNPYRDGSYKYYIEQPVVSDDYKGVAAFIYASLEHELRTL